MTTRGLGATTCSAAPVDPDVMSCFLSGSGWCGDRDGAAAAPDGGALLGEGPRAFVGVLGGGPTSGDFVLALEGGSVVQPLGHPQGVLGGRQRQRSVPADTAGQLLGSP